MSVAVTYPLDELRLASLIDDGWTTLTLWVADTPEGPYTNSGVTPDPPTLAAMQSQDVLTATFEYGSGNPSQWFKVLAYDGANYSDLSASAPFHGGGGTTLAYLRRQLGREMRDLRLGVLAAGSNTTTAVFNSVDILRYQDSFFNGWFLNNLTAGAWSQIGTWTKASGTATVSPAISGQAAGDLVELTRRFTPDEYREALNYAIVACYPVLSRSIVNTSLVTGQNVFQYQVPHDIKTVASVEVESGTFLSSTAPETRGHPWIEVPFRIIRDGLHQLIELEVPLIAGRRLRIMGSGPLSQLYHDSDYVEAVDPQLDILIFAAARYLYGSLANDAASSDVDRYRQLAEYYQGRFMEKRGAYAQPRPAKRLWSAEQRLGSVRGGYLSASFDGSVFP